MARKAPTTASWIPRRASQWLRPFLSERCGVKWSSSLNPPRIACLRLAFAWDFPNAKRKHHNYMNKSTLHCQSLALALLERIAFDDGDDHGRKAILVADQSL